MKGSDDFEAEPAVAGSAGTTHAAPTASTSRDLMSPPEGWRGGARSSGTCRRRPGSVAVAAPAGHPHLGGLDRSRLASLRYRYIPRMPVQVVVSTAVGSLHGGAVDEFTKQGDVCTQNFS